MIIIQEKSVLVLGLQIFRSIQRVRCVCEIIGDRYRLFLCLGKILYPVLRPCHIDPGLQGSMKILRHCLHACRIIRIGEFSHAVCPCQESVIGSEAGPVMIRAVIDRFPHMFLQCGIHIDIVLLTDRLLHLRKQSHLIIMRCKSGQLICQNIIRGRYQHDFCIPPVYQFFQGRNPGIFHLFRVFFRIIYPDQITVCPQIDSIDLLFLKQNIREGLYSHPFIPSYKLVRHIFFVIVAILSRQQALPGKCRSGSQHPVLCLRINSVTVTQVGDSQNEKNRTYQSNSQQSISLIIHTRFLLPCQNRKYKNGL